MGSFCQFGIFAKLHADDM